MRVGFVEWPDGLQPQGPAWEQITASLATERPDVLVTNELPFGEWIASRPVFDAAVAAASIEAHERGVEALLELDIPAIVSSRPVWEGDRLANEAVLIEAGQVRSLHRKQYFPEEPGWHETRWYSQTPSRFETAAIGGITAGALLCTELMFNEHARAYGRAGASLIVVPRATGIDQRSWEIAGAMAALASGAFVVSSNRVGRASAEGPTFGGQGFAFSPSGQLIAKTSVEHPLSLFDLHADQSARARASYPRYVAELLGR
ncbi:carbon-nitrogen hydrolase family protein [Rhizobium binxianense]